MSDESQSANQGPNPLETNAVDETAQYGIGAAARLSGLTVHIIRIWERRYQAVVAQRSPNGRRFYLPADVERLCLLKQLTDAHLSIGTIATLPTGDLKQRAGDLVRLGRSRPFESVDAAVFGAFLPQRLESAHPQTLSFNVQLSGSDLVRFKADLLGLKLDALVLELPIVDAGTADALHDMMASCGAKRGVIVYGFGRQEDVEHLRSEGIRVLRSPVVLDELEQALYQPELRINRTAINPDKDVGQNIAFPDPNGAPPPLRRFDREQLQTLAQASSAVACECPRHLVDLVNDLTAFEIYSRECISLSPEDAELHAYLHHTTARARALIEEALDRVATEEGLL